MASGPAFASLQHAAPPASTSSFNQTCDHQLLDLLWFYGCVATVPSAFCNGAHIAHTLHGAGGPATCTADHKLIVCAQDIKDFHSVLQRPAPHQTQSVNTVSNHSLHQSPRTDGELCNSACVDIIKPSHQHQPLLNAANGGIDIGGGGLWGSTRGDAAIISAKINSVPATSLQECPPSGSPASVKWLRQVFDTFDENKDGMLSTEELRRSLEKLGIETSNESIDSLLSHNPSKDQKGLVSQDEFLLLYQGGACTHHYNNNHDDVEHIDCKIMNENGADEELLWDAFNVFDKDKDGFISPIELQSVLCSLGFGAAQELDECTEMIKRYDQDGDGQVNFEEFKAMLNSAIRHT